MPEHMRHCAFAPLCLTIFAGTLKKAVAAVNSMKSQPDFIIFTGEVTHTTDDPNERRKRMTEAKDIIGSLNVKNVKLMTGEHDASLDNGEAFKKIFGDTHYTEVYPA